MFKKILNSIFALAIFGFLSTGTSHASEDLLSSKLDNV
ncbi:carboxylesterase family protein [Lysinibacillus sp. PB211]|uniref:Uncharacterized protein n=3 Tax=Lysinibacillus TaxID=400634 RepID=B1HYD9_LYSSC|nr:hypothetical protein Bsph_2549 [Lysinibacillus sphaericus C3-41]EWH34218.1 hypothetical protein P799_08180 [Lysinibacillus sphaericus CBAM5]MCS1394642.1 carboxylesterase family protein [Lysinibacillus sp. PB211]